MRGRFLLAATALLFTGASFVAGPARATDAYPVYKGYACNVDGSYQCGGTCPANGCWCCEKPVKTCSA